jgi:hypothetical protein
MQEPATASWGLRISNNDFEKLKAGLQPQDQDDKWHVYILNKEQSIISIHVARSAFNIDVYVLHIVIKPDGDIDSNNGSIVEIASITWETNINGCRVFEEQAKKEVVMITRSNLECEFNTLPEYDLDDMWDYSIADSSNVVPQRGYD